MSSVNIIGIWFSDHPTEFQRLVQSNVLLKMMIAWTDTIYPGPIGGSRN